MDKNQQYFDPYNFNLQSQMNPALNTQMPDPIGLDNISPNMYYEQQYMYYKYLTQMVEYKIKLKELEKLNKEIK